MVNASRVCFQPIPLKATLTPNNDTYRLTHQKTRRSVIFVFQAFSRTPSEPTPLRRCRFFDLHKELIPYKQARAWQKQIVGEKKELIQRTGDCPDTLMVLQHQPVYTMGTGSSENYLNFDLSDPPFDVYRTERGGEVTYHGPGQLVMYPILNLRNHKMDLHWYLRALEEVVIRALSSAFSIEASRVDGLTGVWVGNEKLAAIGIKASQWIAFHGVALNVTTDLTHFDWIVPCGLRDRLVGSVRRLLANCGEDGDGGIIDVACRALVNEFCETFQVEVRHMPTSAPEIFNFKEP